MKLSHGFSLIEVMIFVVIISMVLVIAIGYVTNLMRTMKINEHKIIATYYAEEAREWLKGEREADWNAFSQIAGYNPATPYCFNNEILLTDTISQVGSGKKFPNQLCNSFVGVIGKSPSIYKREITLTKDKLIAPTSIEAEVVVSWYETGVLYRVPVTTKFTVWE